MSMMRSSSRFVALTAATTGLAIGSLTMATDGPANAATASGGATYSCTTPTGTSFQLPADVSLNNLPGTLTAGVTVPAGVPLTLSLNADALANALGTTALAGNYAVNQLSTQVGASPVTNTTTDPLLTQLGSGLLGVTSTLGSFTPNASSLGLPIPTSFDLVPALMGVPGTDSAAACSLDPSSAGTTGFSGPGGAGVIVNKQTVKVKAHQIGHKPMLLVTVKNQTGKAAGQIVAKMHGKKIGKGVLKHGKLRVHLKKLKTGIDRVRVTYAGDNVSQSAHKTVKVKIVRH